MKLSVRYQRSNLLATLILFVLAGFILYFALRQLLVHEVDGALNIEQQELEQYVAKHHQMPEVMKPIGDRTISYVLATGPMQHRHFGTVVLYDTAEQVMDNFRQVNFTVVAGNKWYLVSVSQSLEATEALVVMIAVLVLCTLLGLLIVSVLINRVILHRLWQPFYSALDNVRAFRLGEKQLNLPKTNIDEFVLMNKTLSDATGKASNDYRLLKEFTENAAHETQTPLAIIRSKLDLLIQDDAVSEAQSLIIQTTYEAVNRLTRLNRSLLLLAKIENRQFEDREQIALHTLLEQKLEDLKPLLQEKAIDLKTNIQPTIHHMNPLLADILLNNLLSNAIWHNSDEGLVDIILMNGELVIANTATSAPLNPDHLFTRFFKVDASQLRTGLGLAIIHQVCKASDCTTVYEFASGFHQFKVRWDSSGEHLFAAE